MVESGLPEVISAPGGRCGDRPAALGIAAAKTTEEFAQYLRADLDCSAKPLEAANFVPQQVPQFQETRLTPAAALSCDERGDNGRTIIPATRSGRIPAGEIVEQVAT